MKTKVLNKWVTFKVQEFVRLGYDQVSEADILDYLHDFLWKRQKPIHYVEQVNAIVQITPNQLFDYKTLQIQMQPACSLAELDLSELI